MHGWTDRQICHGYYSGLHCEQCGSAVKSWFSHLIEHFATKWSGPILNYPKAQHGVYILHLQTSLHHERHLVVSAKEWLMFNDSKCSNVRADIGRNHCH